MSHLQRAAQARAAYTGGTRCTAAENRVRPEWADEQNIHAIIARIQRGLAVSARPMGHGVADYRLDRDFMFQAARNQANQYEELPEDIKAQLTPLQFLERAMRFQSLDPDQLRLELEKPAGDTPPAEQTPNT